MLANSATLKAVRDSGFEGDLETVIGLAEMAKEEGGDEETARQWLREIMTTIKVEKAKNKDFRLADLPGCISEQLQLSKELEVKIGQKNNKLLQLNNEAEEISRRNSAMNADFEAKRDKIRHCEEMERACREAGFDLHDRSKFRNCLINLRENEYDWEKTKVELCSINSLRNQKYQLTSDLATLKREVTKETNNLKEAKNKLAYTEGLIRDNFRMVGLVNRLRLSGKGEEYLSKLDAKIVQISSAHGISEADARDVFFANVDEDYGPLLGFKQSKNHYKQQAIEEANRFNEARKNNAEFDRDHAVVKELHSLRYTSEQIVELGSVVRSAKVDPPTLLRDINECGSASEVNHKLRKENEGLIHNKRALRSEIDLLIPTRDKLKKEVQAMESRIKELLRLEMFYCIPDKLFNFFHVIYNNMPPNAAAMQVLRDGVRVLKKHCRTSTLITGFEDIELLIEVAIDDLQKKEYQRKRLGAQSNKA